MPSTFGVSPGVQVREVDLTNVVPAVATSIGAIAGPFEKGPVSSVTTISSEEELVEIFGKPNADNFEVFFTAANFLGYTNNLKVVRTESGILNAGANSGVLIRDTDHYLRQVKVHTVSGLQDQLEHGVIHLVYHYVQVQLHTNKLLVHQV